MPQEQIKELLFHKKRWDRLENGLRKLRDSYQVEGRIVNADKAQMILKTESGADLGELIRTEFPQYWIREFTPTAPKKKGCFGVILIGSVLILGALSQFGCTSHQYDSMRNEQAQSGSGSARIIDNTLVVQTQSYQFVPDTSALIVKARKSLRDEAKARGLKVENLDVTTERNSLLGITSAIVTADIVR